MTPGGIGEVPRQHGAVPVPDVTTMVDDLSTLVAAESFSSDHAAVARCAEAVGDLGRRLLRVGPVSHERADCVHLSWTFGEPRVLILGHFDTVWPIGTIERRPFTVTDGIATGPGVFDMKAGIVQMMHALAGLDSLSGVRILLTSDEEVGSRSSQALVEEMARDVEAVLVVEPSVDGRLKSGRSAVARYTLHVDGVAAHAGLDPESGSNALLELARQLPRISALGAAELFTTVTPTMAAAGTAVNVIPEHASCDIDVRARTMTEYERVDHALDRLAPMDPRASLRLDRGVRRPPFETGASAELLARTERLAHGLGLGVIGSSYVGGGSDGNFTAAMGIPTLDGLGPVGGGAHADHEHVVVSHMPQRATLLRELLRELLVPGKRN